MSGSVAIVGLGALGSAFAALLGAAGVSVTGVVRKSDTLEAIERDGVILREGPKEIRVRITVTRSLPDKKWAAVIVLAKAYDTARVAEQLRNLARTTPVLTLQNGVGNAETLSSALPDRHILAGSTTFGALLEAPGIVRLTGRGECEIGAWNAAAEGAVHPVRQILDRGGLHCAVVPNVESSLWKKLAISSVINPLTALLRVENGALLRLPQLGNVMYGICEEVWQVAARRHLALPTPPELVAEVHRVCELTAANISSMRRDLEQGRRTEIAAINGAVARFGRELSMRTPFNTSLAALIEAASRAAIL